MKPSLNILGQCSIRKVDQQSEIEILPMNRFLLLCAYLATQEGWVNRNALIALFWPDEPEAKVRNKLRQFLYTTKKSVYAEFLEIEESRLRLNLSSDFKAFRKAFEAGDWFTALGYYNGEFLEGAKANKLPAYQDWLELTRHELSDMWREASINYAKEQAEQQDYLTANLYLKAVLEKDLLAEDILHLYLSYCIQSGQRTEGLELAKRFKSLLTQELQMEPLAQTIKLIEELQQVKDVQKPVSPTQDSSEINHPQTEQPIIDSPKIVNTTEHPVLKLPSYSSGFIGRDLELIELKNSLKADHRLITIVGQGGTGKTRLVTELAKQAGELFQDRAVYFSLAPLSSMDYLSNYCLETLQIPAFAQLKPLEQLLAYLANHEHLLIFDNFEHLTGAASLLLQILEASPKSKIIVTSREILSLSSETIYELKGLSYPSVEQTPIEPTEPIEVYESVQLFLRTARHVNANFSLSKENQSAILNICQLLEGSPLTIELAAGWSRLLNPQEIEVELRQNLDMLESTWSDLPERHRSGRAVFEHSWDLLNPSEQALLKKLSVFRGGFSKAAAQNIAGTNLRTLLALLNKSLLRRDSEERFLRHVLVQQYSEEKLALDTELETATKQTHAEYFANFVTEPPTNLGNDDQLSYVKQLELEHVNIRSALDWQLKQEGPAAIQASFNFCNNMSFFWERQCYFEEASDYLKKLHTKIKTEGSEEQQTKTLALVLKQIAFFAYLRSDYTETLEHLEPALKLFLEHEDLAGQCDAYWILASVDILQGKHHETEYSSYRSLELAKEIEDSYREARALARLGGIYERLGKHEEAYDYLEQGWKIFKTLNNARGIVDCLYNMALIRFFKEDFSTAQQFTKEAAKIAETTNYKMRLTDSKNLFGNIATNLENFDEATSYFDEALHLAQSIGCTAAVAMTFENIGVVHKEQYQLAKAKHYLQTGLKLRQSYYGVWGIASSLHRLASLASSYDNTVLAATLWGVSERLWQELDSPKPKSYLKRFERDWEKVKKYLDEASFQQAYNKGQAMALDDAITLALQSDFGEQQKELA